MNFFGAFFLKMSHRIVFIYKFFAVFFRLRCARKRDFVFATCDLVDDVDFPTIIISRFKMVIRVMISIFK